MGLSEERRKEIIMALVVDPTDLPSGHWWQGLLQSVWTALAEAERERDRLNGLFKRQVELLEREESRRFLAESRLRAENARLQGMADENYSDLLVQMDEAWGATPESRIMAIGRIEINAFLESRLVHKPTTRLREENARLRAALLLLGGGEE